MNLYQIDTEIMKLIDYETGEVLDWDKLDELQAAKEQKIENIALYIKNLTAEAAALKAEKDAFAERQKAAEKHAEGLKQYLSNALKGEKFKTTKVNISYRKSEMLEIANGVEIPEDFLKYKEPEINKTELKKAIKDGLLLEGVSIVERSNIQIK